MAPRQAVQRLKPPELFHYSPTYRVVICTACHYAVPRAGIAWHLKEIHHFSPADRKPFLDFVAKLDLCEPKDVVRPTANEFPVPELTVYNGLKCGVQGCAYLCTSQKRLKSHWVTEHKDLSEQDLITHHVPVQTFFRGSKLSYFSGPPEMVSLVHQERAPDPVQALKPAPFSLSAAPPDPPTCLTTGPSCDTLSLLRHYQTSTCKTIPPGVPADEKLWGQVILDMAHEHGFLLDGLLALTSLHLAYLHPEARKQYLIKASEHQGRAMPQFREAITHPNNDNCHAILAFACLLLPYSFASEQQDELFLASNGEAEVVPAWLYFIRSGCVMLCDYWDAVEDGPCGSLAKSWEAPFEVNHDKQQAYLDSLLTIMRAATGEHAWSSEVCAAYSKAAAELASAYSCWEFNQENYTTWDALRIWPTEMSRDFTILLRDLHPAGLILLAHYAVLLKPIESTWYFEGRATKLLRTISYKLEHYWHFALPHP